MPFPGGPPLFDQFVVAAAGEGECVDVGAVSGCPLLDMVYVAPIAGHIAAGARAATILGMNDSVVHPRQDAPVSGFESCRGHCLKSANARRRLNTVLETRGS